MSAESTVDPAAGSGPDGGLRIDEVVVRYGQATAVDQVSIEVGSGEVVAVVGPSGSGKSTLLRAVAGLEPLAAGRIVLGGRDLAGVPTHRRGLGLMFQDHGLFTHLDVAGNVAYGLRVAGVADDELRARVTRLLELVGLGELAGRSVEQLSGGEAQRVALARALAPAPGLLMLDEPLGSLDRGLREQLTGELRRLLRELGQTSLHVTHDQAEAFALADRVAVIDEGRLVALGRPAELWADPGTRFVARFLGHRTLWTVEIGTGGVVRLGDLELGRLSAGHRLVARDAGPVEVVLPSTAVSLGTGNGEGAGRPLSAVIDEVTFDRGRHRLRGRVLVGEHPGDHQVELETTTAIAVGAVVPLEVDLEALRPLEQS